ncbi:unnamed protein product [Symbiodinium necroappetens]|uniref:Uncharacterized protein n=1 Tax=Symbiodinium necroappetens TaxID=1628268 RepID=A0A813C788_9DINO|nr:unnamed protein product [Symbiodinium necroappetens]
MPRGTNKESLKAELLLAGEEVPTRWTKMDMEQRLRELREQGLADSEEVATMTTMESWNKDLRKAARKKATLVEFCQNKLMLDITGNEVMSVLESRALRAIMAQTPAEAGDYVGFGKHAKAQKMDNLEMSKEPIPFPSKGYMMYRKGLEKGAGSGGKSGSSARGSQDVADHVDKSAKEKDRQMAMMAETLEMLRAEMSELKAERPRKTVVRTEDEGMTDGSFNVVSDGEPTKRGSKS